MDSRERFGWSDDDVVMKDREGNVMMPRQVLEQQVTDLRQQLDDQALQPPDEPQD